MELAWIAFAERADDDGLVAASHGQGGKRSAELLGDPRGGEAERELVARLGHRRTDDHDAGRPRRHPRRAGDRLARTGRRLPSGQEILEQVTANAVAFGDQQLLGFQVGLGGVRRGVVDVAHELGDRIEGQPDGLLVLVRQLPDVLPHDEVADPEGVHEVGQRHTAAGPEQRVRPDERELLGGRRLTAAQHGAEHLVMLARVRQHVADQPLIFDRRVAGDLQPVAPQALLRHRAAA